MHVVPPAPSLLRLSIAGALVAVASCSGSSSGDGSSATTGPTAAASSTTGAVAPTSPFINASVVITGPEEIVFDWSEDRCREEHKPDLPALAYRDAEGMVNLILSSPTIHRMVGPELGSVVVDCDPVRSSTMDPDPSQFDFRGWMGSLYTEDGETIHAVIHNEYHGDVGAFAQADRDFSDQQGAGGWTYLGRIGTTESLLDFSDGTWKRGSTLCSVSQWGAHPSNDCDAVRRWTASEPGEISVWVSVADVGIGGGDGVDVGFAHNGTDLWTFPIEEGDEVGTELELDLTVDVGDQLDFWVASRGDAGFDSTTFRIEINRGERRCTVDIRDRCLMMALTYAMSTDGGATYQSPDPPNHLIATLPERYVPDAGYVGMWQPSNIIRHPTDGYYYMLAQFDIQLQPRSLSGECLLRTDDLSDPKAWRAWDGEAFEYVFLDPYRADVSGAQPCQSVEAAPISSLTYNTYLERFVALTENQFRNPQGMYMITSTDLIDWREFELVMGPPDWTIGFATGYETPFEAYPTFIDPDSNSRSFDTVGETAYLYFTRINSFTPLDFDLLRVPVRFEK